MDEEKKLTSTSENTNNKPNTTKKGKLNKNNKSKLSIITNKKTTTYRDMNIMNDNTSIKNRLIPISEKHSISKAKKHNSIGFASFQSKLNANSSYKTLDYGRRTSNSINPLSNTNNTTNNDATNNLNANNDANNSKLGNTPINKNYELNINENLNMNNNDKSKDVVNSFNNANATNPDLLIQRHSVVSGRNDISVNQVSVLENKNVLSPNAYKNVNNFSQQNSINNISTSSDSNHIKVTVRFRPMNNVENEMVEKKIGFKCVDFKSADTIGVTNSFNNSQIFTFDHVYNDKTTQEILYTETAKPLITDILKGYNGTIFTYGQSGSGKTYTMYGAELLDEETQGIIPRAINEIFEFINAEENKEIRFELKFSMLEIYQEQLNDLLNPGTKSQDLKIKEHSKKGIYVENLSEVYISSEEEFLVLIHEAEKARIVKETGLNKCSSRSHLLFQLQITQKFPDDTERRGLLNLIDLAGSEKVSKTHAIGETLNEAKKINSSLSILGKVISILATNTGEYVPYRESKLTRILQDSLGGNSKTILIVNCSIHSYNADETIYTLNFAKRAKKIKNKVKINIKHSAEQLEAIIEILSNKLRLANEEINKLKGNIAAYPIKSSSMLLIGNEEISSNLIPKSLENSLIKNLFTTTFNGISNNNTVNNNVNVVSNNLHGNEILDSAELIKDLNLKLKKKDEEIALLNDKLDMLQIENKNMQEKIEIMNKQNNMDKYIESLDKSLRDNLDKLKQIILANKKDEIEALTQRMSEIKKFYDNFEINYVHLFKKITDFKETDFETKINMIINENFNDIINETKDKFSVTNNKNTRTNNNLSVNINHFNNINNITVHNHNNSINKINYNNFSNSNFENNKNYKNEKDILSRLNQNDNIISEISNIKPHQNTEESISPPKNKKGVTKKLSFQDPDSILDFVKPANKNSSSPSAILSFNNSNKNSSENREGQNKNPYGLFKNNNNTTKTLRSQLKKGKNNNNIQQEINKDSKIDNNNNNNNNNKEDYLSKLKRNSKAKFNHDDNFDDFIKGVKNDKQISTNIPGNKELIFESSTNVKSNDFKNNIISEYLKKPNIESVIDNKNKEIKKNEIPIIEFDNEDENNSLCSNAPQFGGNVYSFNFYCENLFKKIETQISSDKKLNSSDLIVLSYKKLYLSNKLFSLEIFDDFLKTKDNYKLDLINNAYQKSHNDLLMNNSMSKNQNAFNIRPVNNSSLFSPETRNNKINFIKDNYFMSPNSDIKDFDKMQANIIENNLFTNRINNHNKNNTLNNNNHLNFTNNNDNCLDYNQNNWDYFTKMKNCIIKLMLKIIYFENINHDLLNRLTIDLKIFHNKSKNSSKVEEQLEKISKIFTNYLDVLEELKKFKINSEYEGKKFIRAENFDFKCINTPIPQESYLNSANNLNHIVSTNNLYSETNNYNNPLVLTEIKKFARLSTVQQDIKNISNTNIPVLLQPKNSIFKQSKMNLNSNIIKNITKRSSLVLNNLGLGLAFRKSVYEPTASNCVLCPNCNNYYNNNNAIIKPFNIGINEDGNEVKNTTLSNTQLNNNLISNEKGENSQALDNKSYNYINMITDTNLITEPNKEIFDKIKTEDIPIQNKSLEKEMMISNSSGKTISLAKSRNPSKNVSFYITTEQKDNLVNNIEKNNNTIDKSNLISNADKSANNNLMKNFNKNSILKVSKLKNYQNMNNYYNNSNEKKFNHDSKLVNESDASMDNVSHSKFFKGPSPGLELMDRNKFFNQNINLDSNKNMDLITNYNCNNNLNTKINSQTQISKMVSTNNCKKMQLHVMKPNSTQNKDLNDFEPSNIRSKWEALRQSVISTTSNNNLKFIQDENFSELKLAKKETLLYKNCFNSITTDYKKLKSNCKNTEKIMNQEIENYKNLKEIEIKKFAKALEMYNQLYTQQIKVKDIKIKQLATLIDYMVDNELNYLSADNLFTSNNNNTIPNTEELRKKYDFILERKNLILNTSKDLYLEENAELSLIKLTDFLINQEGTATKKLDYITIELNDNPELIKFKYGSGLGHKLPTKSPLFRNLTNTLAGDQNNEITISELSD